MIQNCGNCRFFLEAPPEDVTSVGVCRRFPPQRPTDQDLALFPFIWDWDVWCGEWQAEPPEAS